MAMYFESTVCYYKILENGSCKKVNEKHLCDSLTVSECEARTIEEMTPFISGDFTVKVCKRTKISEVFFNENADRFYLVNVAFITLNENTGAEKQTVTQILVQANDFDGAVSAFKEGMKQTMADWKILSVAETPYMGVYPAKLSGDGE